MRTCYQIHTHRSPEQVYRLIAAIADTSHDPLFVVSHDRAGEPLDPATLARWDCRLLLTDGGYADWSHTRRYLEVLAVLDRAREHYDWMVNLSGQDYPVRPSADSEDELRDSAADGFVEQFDVLSPDSPWGVRRGRDRYWFRHRRLLELSDAGRRRLRPLQAVNRLQPWVRLNTAAGLTVGRRVSTPFGPELRCRGGSFFMSVNGAAIEQLRRFTRDRPDVVAHFQRTLSPAESFFQTALTAGGGLSLVDDCKRYFDFAGSTQNHPRTLAAADVPVAREAGAHFARKWDLRRDPDAFALMDSFVRREAA